MASWLRTGSTHYHFSPTDELALLTARETHPEYRRRKVWREGLAVAMKIKGSQGHKRVEWVKVEHPFTAISPACEVHANHNEAQNSALRRFLTKKLPKDKMLSVVPTSKEAETWKTLLNLKCGLVHRKLQTFAWLRPNFVESNGAVFKPR